LDDEELDLAKVKFSDFYRELDMKTGIMTRSFVWETASGKKLKLIFERLISMTKRYYSGQKIVFKPLNFSGTVTVISGIDFTPIHEEENENYWTELSKNGSDILCQTRSSKQRVYSKFWLNQPVHSEVKSDKIVANQVYLNLTEGRELIFTKVVANVSEKDQNVSNNELKQKAQKSYIYELLRAENVAFWQKIWNELDIEIDGDPENQQGIRFCIFNMHQTYHGEDGSLNVGAKGLTGEKYSGWTFWDTETYCLPFYMFNNKAAAKNLIMYRYNTLKQAKERAIEQDCKGACFPMVTIDGTESCGVWQHGNLEIHVTAAVAYAVWHYVLNTKDTEFLYNFGAELLIETSRYFASRGGWSPKTGEFGLYGVMGPDEFHMMVHNNTYTNYIVKKMFEYTLEVVNEMKQKGLKTVFVSDEELADWKKKAEKMRINYDEKTKLYEQHDGYFDLPETDVAGIPADKVPIYKYWAYDSIFRCNMLKQPDVVLMQFFFSKDFTKEQKKINFDFYEKRCSHESSLSPAIHSIMAAEIGNKEMAYEYARYGSRLDLDDYNRNVHQGLHITSMSAAWMNIVYGFGGMRTDDSIVSFAPTIPKEWNGYKFKILLDDKILNVAVTKEKCVFSLNEGQAKILIYGKETTISKNPLEVNLSEI
jgi:maltose phosphorylase